MENEPIKTILVEYTDDRLTERVYDRVTDCYNDKTFYVIYRINRAGVKEKILINLSQIRLLHIVEGAENERNEDRKV